MIKLSIIIVNFEATQMLDECLGSIFKHLDSISFEVIVVDNSIKEKGIKQIVEKYSNTKFINNNENRGFSIANNQGIELVEGEYILFLNNDTLFVNDPIEPILNFINSKGEELLVGCKMLNKDGSHQISVTDFDNLFNLFGEVLFLYKIFKKSRLLNKYYFHYQEIEDPLEVDVVKGAFILGKTSSIKSLGGFDERFFFYSEETDLCFRFKRNGGKVFYYPNSQIIHLGGATTVSMPWFNYKNQSLAKLQFFRKNFSKQKYFSASVLHFIGISIRIPLYILIGIITLDISHIKKSYYYFKLLTVFP